MGLAKNWMIEQQARGWRSAPDKYVCSECADDAYLAQMLRLRAESERCDFCDHASTPGSLIAAPLDVFMEFVMAAVGTYWADPAEELSYETAEGGYQGDVIDTFDLFTGYLGYEWPEGLVEQAVQLVIQDSWCKRHYGLLRPHERLAHGWRRFEDTTKHRSRYAALLPPLNPDAFAHPDDVPASAMLDEVARCADACGLFSRLAVGTRLCRARAHPAGVLLRSAEDLGAPTPERARFANRMSAAGIAVFYGAMDELTAIVESFDPSDEHRLCATVCQFETVRPLNVLNLCEMPPIPSYFDLAQASIRHARLFLSDFVEAVSRPTRKDGQEHIDYVPTQIFAEFVRYRVRREDGESVHGIMYPSAKISGGRCIALFCDSSACAPAQKAEWVPREQWLSLDERSIRFLERADCIETYRQVGRLTR